MLLLFLLLRPVILKPMLRRYAASMRYEPLPVAKRSSQYIVYSESEPSEIKQRDLIVLFIGGAFLIQSIEAYYGIANQLYTLMSKTHDVLVVQYPVRFAHTITESMLVLNQTLAEVAMPYKACHFVGFSAGALLAGTFIRKEMNKLVSQSIEVPQIGLRVDSMISVCGMLYSSFDNDILNWVFQYYIMHKTKSPKSYGAQALNVPTLVISCKDDILYNQTVRYVQSEPCQSKIFDERLPHVFAQMINLPESKIVVERIAEFIKDSTNSQ